MSLLYQLVKLCGDCNHEGLATFILGNKEFVNSETKRALSIIRAVDCENLELLKSKSLCIKLVLKNYQNETSSSSGVVDDDTASSLSSNNQNNINSRPVASSSQQKQQEGGSDDVDSSAHNKQNNNTNNNHDNDDDDDDDDFHLLVVFAEMMMPIIIIIMKRIQTKLKKQHLKNLEQKKSQSSMIKIIMKILLFHLNKNQ